MTAAGTFILSVCAGTLIFSLIMFIVPDKGSGKAVRIAAAAFMLTVILRSAAETVTEFEDVFAGQDRQTSSADTLDSDAYIGMQASLALRTVIADRLTAAGCDFSDLTVNAVYSDGSFQQVTVSLWVPDTDDAVLARQTAEELGLDFDIETGERLS